MKQPTTKIISVERTPFDSDTYYIKVKVDNKEYRGIIIRVKKLQIT